MKIRMLSLAAGPEGVWPRGEEVEIEATLAWQLIAGGYAVAVEPPAALETAAIQPPEAAVIGRKRGTGSKTLRRPGG